MISAYIDESGTPILGDGKYYVITAIMSSEDDKITNELTINEVRKDVVSGSQIKSSKVGSDYNRRVGIISKMMNIKFKIVSICIDKSLVNSQSGLRFKTSMYKYCQRKLFNIIYKEMISIKVVCDNYGSKEFMTSFENYISKHFKENIFSIKEFIYSDPLTNPMLQVADFIGGSIRRVLENQDVYETLDLFKDHIFHIETWPTVDNRIMSPRIDNDINAKIADCAYRSILNILETESDPLLIEFCNYIAFDCSLNDGFINGDVILKYLKRNGFISDDKNKNWLMQFVIGKLRDKGAIIAASRDGYKIPDCQEDIEKFAAYVSDKTIPYLRRFKNMRDALYFGTGVRYDLLDDFPDLRSILTK